MTTEARDPKPLILWTIAMSLLFPPRGVLICLAGAMTGLALASIPSLVEGPGFYPYLSGRDNLRVVARWAGVGDTAVLPALAGAGWALQENYEAVERWLNPVTTIVVLLIVGLYLWRLGRGLMARR